MAGILLQKERILDTILTDVGKRQLAAGKLNAAFYSFTDTGTFYVQDTSFSASQDGTRRIYLEASNLPQDQITFESDEQGKLVSFPSVPQPVRNGTLLTVALGGSSPTLAVSGSAFSTLADTLLSGSTLAFANNYILGSPDIFGEDVTQFLASPGGVSFVINNSTPIPTKQQAKSVESLDPLFVDSRIGHLPNFKFLPPTNKAGTPLGVFAAMNQARLETYKDILISESTAIKNGFLKTITFADTTMTNNLVCQLFEIGGNGNEVAKLDVIDFGIYNVATNQDMSLGRLSASSLAALKMTQAGNPTMSSDGTISTTKHVFFAGKIFTNSDGVDCFVNLFTVIFESR